MCNSRSYRWVTGGLTIRINRMVSLLPPSYGGLILFTTPHPPRYPLIFYSFCINYDRITPTPASAGMLGRGATAAHQSLELRILVRIQTPHQVGQKTLRRWM